MNELEKSEFIVDQFDDYGKRMYKNYINLTNEQKDKIIKLKELVGNDVQFLYRNKIQKMKLMSVCLFKGDITSYPLLDNNGNLEYDNNGNLFERSYRGYPFTFRLNYTDNNKFRDYDGFWTNKIDNIIYE
jgi:hypothetical protein